MRHTPGFENSMRTIATLPTEPQNVDHAEDEKAEEHRDHEGPSLADV